VDSVPSGAIRTTCHPKGLASYRSRFILRICAPSGRFSSSILELSYPIAEYGAAPCVPARRRPNWLRSAAAGRSVKMGHWERPRRRGLSIRAVSRAASHPRQTASAGPSAGAVSFGGSLLTRLVRESPWDQDSGRKSYRCRSLFRMVVIAYWMRSISPPSRVKT
jgi:hypothetical protein